MNLVLCRTCQGELPDTSLIDGQCYPCFTTDRADELLTLEHERKQALALADEMAEIANSLRAVATGTASSLEISDVTGNIRPSGYLTIEAAFDWQLILRHARPEAGR